MSPSDYPAAHSMDTDWFAVDADGHVALMKSGEPGPVPVGLEAQRSGHDVLKTLAMENPFALLNRHCSDVSRQWGVVMLLSATTNLQAISAPLPKDFDTSAPFKVAEDSVVAASVFIVPDEFFAEIHRKHLCLGCMSLFDEDEAAPRLGLYFYDAGDRYQSGPYERGELPADPVALAALPTSVRESLAAVVIPEIRFREAAAIQPLEHLPCTTWGAGDQYLASDLKTLRPMPPDEQTNG